MQELLTRWGQWKGNETMSMTRDAYAKEVIRVAEAAFLRNEDVICPHEDCEERLSVVQQSTYSTRSLFCPVHGHIFQEQTIEPFSRLDWDAAAARARANESFDLDDEEDEEDSEDYYDA